MARPRAKELTERELEIMHVFWEHGEQTAQEVRDRLAKSGLRRAYTTIATLVRILYEKGFLEQTNDQRPFRFSPVRSHKEVSGRMSGDLIDRVFNGSRELLLARLVEQRRLSARERKALEQIIEDKGNRS